MPSLSGQGIRVLDVACGFGRHAGPLAGRGYQVVGVDSSRAQIERARHSYPGVSFLVADMREPPPGPFDVILNLWTSFGLLPTEADDLAALIAWRSVLAPGGTLIMDLTTLERAEHTNRKGDEPVTSKEVTRDGVTTQARYDWGSRTSFVRYSRGGWSRACRTRLYSRPELDSVLRKAGFTTVTFRGDFRCGPVDPAKRTVVIATADSEVRDRGEGESGVDE
ncbi:class I SAM-dependent methyltransferase [Streptomyces sp. NPDC001795]|uniref:class I SAM-dependent methyltransferase n=1 Tax=Streptomyces sp. NPDC001795 TaxID=3154525 RepID=UPI0033195D93